MKKESQAAGDLAKIAAGGTLLANEGDEIARGLWERCVYLANDGFVYQIDAIGQGKAVRPKIVSKRAVGDYLRWVDGVFKPGEVPSESNGIHYRAARLLRELI